MASNPFDQFDAPAASGGNPFDQFDAAEPAPIAAAPAEEQPAAAPAPAAAPDPSAGGGELRPFGIDTGIQTPEWLNRGFAGAGKAISDLGRGMGQVISQYGMRDFPMLAPEARQMKAAGEAQVADARERDQPLMATTAGKVGNVAGNIAATIPALAVPGANTVAGAGAIGTGLGLLSPAESDAERMANTAVGGTVGAAAQGIGGKIAQFAQSKITQRAMQAQSEKAQNAVRDATLKEARKAGYVVPPSTTNPTVANRVAESISGKAATQQSAAVKNQAVTNRLVRQELGLSMDSPLTKKTLNAIRSKEGEVYKALKSAGRITADDAYLDDLSGLSQSIDDVARDFPDANVGANQEIDKLVNSLLRDNFDSGSAVEYVKQLRKQASGNLSFAASADPSKKALGLAQRDAAAALEDMLIRHLESTGKGTLAKRFDAARTMIAKTYSVEAALNEGSGNIVAGQLANQLKRGKPLSGNLATAAKFAQAFPKAAAEVRDSPGVSAVDALVGGIGGITINPALAALPVGRIAARSAVLSRPYQNALAQPNYSPGATGNALLRTTKAVGKRAALPSIAYAAQE